MRSGFGLGGVVGIVAVLLVPIPLVAEDTAPAAPRYVHPSVEELAIPQARDPEQRG